MLLVSALSFIVTPLSGVGYLDQRCRIANGMAGMGAGCNRRHFRIYPAKKSITWNERDRLRWRCGADRLQFRARPARQRILYLDAWLGGLCLASAAAASWLLLGRGSDDQPLPIPKIPRHDGLESLDFWQFTQCEGGLVWDLYVAPQRSHVPVWREPGCYFAAEQRVGVRLRTWRQCAVSLVDGISISPWFCCFRPT